MSTPSDYTLDYSKFNFRSLLIIATWSLFLLGCDSGGESTGTETKMDQSMEHSETPATSESLHGSYCAEVTYSNANTGTHSNYSLLVDVKDNQVICIHWPQGGQLDLDHFNPVQISSDSTSQIQTFEGKQYRVKIVGPESACSERFQGQLHHCKGTTKEGKRCKRMTDNPSGYCYQHEGK